MIYHIYIHPKRKSSYGYIANASHRTCGMTTQRQKLVLSFDPPSAVQLVVTPIKQLLTLRYESHGGYSTRYESLGFRVLITGPVPPLTIKE